MKKPQRPHPPPPSSSRAWPSLREIEEGIEQRKAEGRQRHDTMWVRIDAFPRETVREDREGRAGWERANRAKNTG